MHRIDDPTAVPTLPAPRPPGAPGYFTGGSPGTGGEAGTAGFLATRVRYEFMNALQEELSAIVEASGLILDKTNNAQVLAALRQMLRFKLGQDETFYIAPTGSDTNDGLTAATPLKTGQAAWNKALTIDLNGHNLYLQFAAGTYTDQIFCNGQPLGLGNGNAVIIQGNITSPQTVIFETTSTNCIYAHFGAYIYVTGVTLRSHVYSPAYLSGIGLVADAGSTLLFGNVHFDQCDTAHMVAVGANIGNNKEAYQIIGGAGYHIISSFNSLVDPAGCPVSLTNTPHFNSAFATATICSVVDANGMAFAGAATGSRFKVDSNSVISTGAGGPNYFPGDTAGVVDAATYGVYV